MRNLVLMVMAFFVFIQLGLGSKWQTIGEFSSDQIEFVKTLLDEFSTDLPYGLPYKIGEQVSKALSTAWKSSWSVFVARVYSNRSALHAYAFR